MIEKEIKILNIDMDTIDKLLLSKGCILCKSEIQENSVFKKDNISIKLRYTDSLIEDYKTYEIIRKIDINKKRNSKYKIKDELSRILTKKEYYFIEKVFEFMEFNKVLCGIKRRKSYKLNGYLYEIDKWDENTFPIPYLEIEALDPKLSIKEICTKSGYTDPNYFSRIFKKSENITPSEYRERIQQNSRL
jgi:AraC-like DNA-binding protein